MALRRKLTTEETYRRVALDFVAGIGAAGAVSPIIATVDKAVVENAAGKLSLTASVRNSLKSIFTRPGKYFKAFEFRWIWLVYGSTYIANNSVDSLCKLTHTNDVAPKLVFVTLVNMLMSILKDKAFAKNFGTSGQEKVKPVSIFIWMIRDVITMAAAFVIPSRVAKIFEKQGLSNSASQNLAQFLCPITFQLFLTPIHLLGLDFYNFPGQSLIQRGSRIARLYPSSTLIRMMRMGSAYGIGGVSNRKLRNIFHTKTEGANWDKEY